MKNISGAKGELLICPHLRNKGADLVLNLHEATQASLHDGGKVEQPQCVAGGGSVEDHNRKVHPFH